ncbi:unnamed protein product [Pleuronectes platessa]|uniref:Uncharacterized protein n=1 Tax=Pleuronectes platessa TaxID=8262 RepID=A0A9N7Z1X2_PLEPL|nr:unnamed protein product [Pleuronectes platessa]
MSRRPITSDRIHRQGAGLLALEDVRIESGLSLEFASHTRHSVQIGTFISESYTMQGSALSYLLLLKCIRRQARRMHAAHTRAGPLHTGKQKLLLSSTPKSYREHGEGGGGEGRMGLRCQTASDSNHIILHCEHDKAFMTCQKVEVAAKFRPNITGDDDDDDDDDEDDDEEDEGWMGLSSTCQSSQPTGVGRICPSTRGSKVKGRELANIRSY